MIVVDLDLGDVLLCKVKGRPETAMLEREFRLLRCTSLVGKHGLEAPNEDP